MITSNWYLNKEQNIWSTPLNFKTGDRKKHGNYFNTEPDHIYYWISRVWKCWLFSL